MFNNFKFPVVVFIAAAVLTIFGAFLKVIKVPGGGFIMGSMMFAQGIDVVWMVVLLFKRGG